MFYNFALVYNTYVRLMDNCIQNIGYKKNMRFCLKLLKREKLIKKPILSF